MTPFKKFFWGGIVRFADVGQEMFVVFLLLHSFG